MVSPYGLRGTPCKIQLCQWEIMIGNYGKPWAHLSRTLRKTLLRSENCRCERQFSANGGLGKPQFLSGDPILIPKLWPGAECRACLGLCRDENLSLIRKDGLGAVFSRRWQRETSWTERNWTELMDCTVFFQVTHDCSLSQRLPSMSSIQVLCTEDLGPQFPWQVGHDGRVACRELMAGQCSRTHHFGDWNQETHSPFGNWVHVVWVSNCNIYIYIHMELYIYKRNMWKWTWFVSWELRSERGTWRITNGDHQRVTSPISSPRSIIAFDIWHVECMVAAMHQYILLGNTQTVA